MNWLQLIESIIFWAFMVAIIVILVFIQRSNAKQKRETDKALIESVKSSSQAAQRAAQSAQRLADILEKNNKEGE